jgi:hypothetical protein
MMTNTLHSAKLLIAIVLAAGAIIGCASAPIPGIRLLSVEPAEHGEFGDVLHDRPLRSLKVNFALDVDLFQVAKRREFNIGFEAYFCSPNDPSRVRIGGGYVYSGEMRVSPYQQGSVASTNVYHVFLPIQRAAITEGNLPSPKVDLLSESRDICVRIDGGNMLGESLRSDEMVVSKALIANALREVPAKSKGSR